MWMWWRWMWSEVRRDEGGARRAHLSTLPSNHICPPPLFLLIPPSLPISMSQSLCPLFFPFNPLMTS